MGFKLPANHRPWMTVKVSDNQCGQSHPSDSWVSYFGFMCYCVILHGVCHDQIKF